MYGSGIFHGCDKAYPIVNHAVTLMGYGEVDLGVNGTAHYWLMRNSWGPTWGEKGYMRLQRLPDGESCGVDTKPLTGFGCATDPPGNVTVCGECGILSMSSYPYGAFLGPPSRPEDPALSTSEVPDAPQDSASTTRVAPNGQHDQTPSTSEGRSAEVDPASMTTTSSDISAEPALSTTEASNGASVTPISTSEGRDAQQEPNGITTTGFAKTAEPAPGTSEGPIIFFP